MASGTTIIHQIEDRFGEEPDMKGKKERGVNPKKKDRKELEELLKRR